MSLPTFVLVHGAFRGGWCWKPVAARLRAQGHSVYTPTLTGLGERSHLVHAEVSLETFIEDIAQVLRYEDLNDVVLVGHSFADSVVSAVALDAGPERNEQTYSCRANVFLANRRERRMDTPAPARTRRRAKSPLRKGFPGWARMLRLGFLQRQRRQKWNPFRIDIAADGRPSALFWAL